ncbi:hypothetical protein UFOVP1361_18 [uncultured Caudovirales phage]|uniref:Uncharacterized protein n=1 Tax=uncultured Caudovirales phage TaxID=2100421 RepID=A0A6J5S2Q3_9CAUD|nr:hypothetical protein UFOVP1361_18 [uncultured Caudovirales phage]
MFNIGDIVYVKDGFIENGFIAPCSYCQIMAIEKKLAILKTQHHGDIVKMIHEINHLEVTSKRS